jgi:hypothetical protein
MSTAMVSPGAQVDLRHTLATVAYRAAKAFRNAPPEFGAFKASPHTRTPAEIVSHMGDLYDWALTIARGNEQWRGDNLSNWQAAVDRFFASLKHFDDYLAAGHAIASPAGKIYQGAIADSLTHIGQINILRGIFGSPVKGESYYRSEITVGRVGPDQAPPRREF